MPAARRRILEICAAVARSHGKNGEIIALAISRINLDELFGPGHEKFAAKRLKYIYRKIWSGREYVYFRMPNGRLFPLPVNENSAEFRKQYQRCLRMVPHFREPRKSSKAPL